jgi:superfamily I DNA and/or RNA helicase/transcription elongation GreA/GreB family factor
MSNVNSRSDRIERLINYLRGLATLRTKIIQRIDDYPYVIWLYEISEKEKCFCKLDDKKEDSNIVAEIKLPKKPYVPEELEIYIEGPATDKINEPIESNDILIKYKEILKEFKEWQSIHEIYLKFYSIYQENLKLEEEYEFLLCFGLLSWRSKKKEELLKRHIISIKVNLEFDPKLQKFIIHEDLDSKPKIETEFIPIEELPEGFEKLKDEGLDVIEKNGVWSKELEEYFKKFINSFHPDGKYINSLQPDLKNYPLSPVIEYAPALIYRKRSIGPFYDFLTSIPENIRENGANSALNDLAEIEDNKQTDDFENPSSYFQTSEVFFPLPYNEEQFNIIKKLEKSNVVLVQGPPGTGKSHTIVNLICHLLANNKRILITSKSSRALRVLQNLIPHQIRSLCIVTLGSDMLGSDIKTEREELEKSVSDIFMKLNEWTFDDTNKIDKLENQLKILKQEETEIQRKLQEFIVKENEQKKITARYQGTPSEIAKLVKTDSPKYQWFRDKIKYDQDYDIFDIDWQTFLLNVQYFNDNERKKLLKSNIPPIEEIINPDEIEILFNKEIEFLEILKNKPNINMEYFKILSKNPEKTKDLKDLFLKYRKALLNLVPKIEIWGWRKNLAKECLYVDSWELNIRESSELLNNINRDDIDNNSVKISINKPIETILEDIAIVKDYLSLNSKRWFNFIKPKKIRERQYVFKNIFLNEKKCKTVDDLSIVYSYLKAEINIKKILQKWSSYIPEIEGSVLNKFDKLSEIIKTLYEIRDLKMLKDDCIKALLEFDYIMPDFINYNEIKEILDACDYVEYSSELNKIKKTIEKYTTKYTNYINYEIHEAIQQIVEKFIGSLQNRDIKLYKNAFQEVERLHSDKIKLQELQTIIEKLKSKLPKLIEDILKDPQNIEWEEKIKLIPDAWEWAQAKSWIEIYTNENSYSFNKELEETERKKREVLTKIVELKSWQFLKNLISEEDRKHLIAWKNSVKKLGKGTGKYAYKYRKDAQKHLNYVKRCIPAWIMPLHRLWDTIKPEKNFFDVLIIDEASQIGFEGIPLLYIAEKILIVGDDKQISPEAVGIDRSNVHRLIDEFLYDFKFKDMFDVETSIFSHAELRYSSSKLLLREHFRCMPEIIEFCNRLSYGGSLIPLKQYPLNRLNPLEKVYVHNAQCEGEGASIRNKTEAEFIVNKIYELCKDKKYENKTMGVIILQGQEQANIIQKKLIDKIDINEVQKHKIICGNPYSFQGDERDIIFLSMVIAPNKRIGVLNSEPDRRRFNVAVSRAKEQIWLFYSVKRDDLHPTCFRRQLLEYFDNPDAYKPYQINWESIEQLAYEKNRNIEKPPHPFESWFEFDVASELRKEEYYIIPQYKVAHYRIDLVIEDGNKRLAVECDGDIYHSGEQIEKDFYRQRILERANWKFFRIRASDFYYRKETVMKDLRKTLELHEIFPQKSNMKKPIKENPIIVEVNDRVKYIDLSLPTAQEKEVLIVQSPSDPTIGVINYQTPVAKALLGHTIGDTTEVKLPTGVKKYKILDVFKPDSTRNLH